MGTKFLALFRCTDSKRILTAIGAFALLAFAGDTLLHQVVKE